MNTKWFVAQKDLGFKSAHFKKKLLAKEKMKRTRPECHGKALSTKGKAVVVCSMKFLKNEP